MTSKSIDLIWIVVQDLKKAIKFYVETMGLQLMNSSEEHGWAEMKAENGARLGIAQYQSQMPLSPGHNAVVTLTVEDLHKARDALLKKGVVCIGEIQEVPGHVRLQLVRDLDGNHLQLVQMLGISE